MSLQSKNTLSHVDWESIEPITMDDIIKMRKEFWETAYAYEGHKETWELLRDCVGLIHESRVEEAREMLMVIGITMPNGTLQECYDETGVKYDIPDYIISPPRNLMSKFDKMRQQLPQGQQRNELGDILNLKLSDGRNISLNICSEENVKRAKERLQKKIGVPVDQQRWYFGGRALLNNMALESYNLHESFMVQVIVHNPIKPDGIFD